MPGLLYQSLTNEQILYVWNGLGTEYFWYKPPAFCFDEGSKVHDFRYYKGGNEVDRWRADFWFFRDCVKASFTVGRWYHIFPAILYYLILIFLGIFSFEYKPKCKTWEELKARLDADPVRKKQIAQSKIAKFINYTIHNRVS